MKTNNRSGRNRRGSALMVIMLYASIVTIAVASIVVVAMNAPNSIRKTSNYLRASAIAETGINDAYSKIATNFARCTNATAFPLTSYGNGTFDATATVTSSNTATIVSVGTYKGSTATIAVDVKNYGSGTTSSGSTNLPPVGAYAYAIMANSDITISGSGDFNVGTGLIQGNTIFSKSGSGGFTAGTVSFVGASSMSGSWTLDSDFKIGGDYGVSGSGQINHNVWCKNMTCSGSFKILGNGTCLTYSKSGSGGVMGTLTTGVTPVVNAVPMPTLDLTPYYNWALANGQVFSNKSISGSADVVPVGGIMWVNGTLNISGSGRLIGCFIATGNISISGSGSQLKVANYPALVSRDGNIDISGSQDFHGLLYTRIGTFSKSGSGLVTGSIICGSTFTASGSWSALCYENSTPIAPGGGSGGSGTAADAVVITAWKR